MKKNVIAVMLSLVLTVGSVGAPVFAAESATTQEAVEISEEGTTEEEPAPEEEDTDEEEQAPGEEDIVEEVPAPEAEDADEVVPAPDGEDINEEESAPEEETTGEEVSESDPEEEVSKAGVAESEQDEEASEEQELHEDAEEKDDSDDKATAASEEEGEDPSAVVDDVEPVDEGEVDEDLTQEDGTKAALDGNAIDSGTCGDNLKWTLEENGDGSRTLTISGNGEMDDYEMNQSPFFSLGFDTVIVEEGVTTLGSSCLRQCGFASITLPDSLESIGESAFFSCNNLENITISDGVTSIGYNAFFYCKKLQNITLSDNLRSIESRAFCYCSSLQSITLPNNLESIGDCAFQHCNSLTSITVPDSVTSLHDHAFDDYPGEIRVYAGSYAETFAKNHNLNYTVIGNVQSWPPKPVSMLAISGIANKTYNRKAQTQAVVVKDGTTTLKSGTDYTVFYKNNINAGTATVTITGIGNYTGTVNKTFTIRKAVNAVTASGFTRSYSAKAQTIKIGAKATGGKLTYKPNKTKVKVTSTGKVTLPAKFTGTVKIKITAGNKNYNTATKTISITVPSKTKLSSVTSPSAGKMKVKWKKNTKVNGYQIQYSLKSNFKKARKVTIKKNKTTSKQIKGLKKGKKYYVRIRSFKTVNGKKFYSAWSAKKAVTIKE